MYFTCEFWKTKKPKCIVLLCVHLLIYYFHKSTSLQLDIKISLFKWPKLEHNIHLYYIQRAIAYSQLTIVKFWSGKRYHSGSSHYRVPTSTQSETWHFGGSTKLSTTSNIQTRRKTKRPPTPCWSYSEWHYSYFCPFKKMPVSNLQVVRTQGMVLLCTESKNFQLFKRNAQTLFHKSCFCNFESWH